MVLGKLPIKNSTSSLQGRSRFLGLSFGALERWSVGVLERWRMAILKPQHSAHLPILQYSNTPLLPILIDLRLCFARWFILDWY